MLPAGIFLVWRESPTHSDVSDSDRMRPSSLLVRDASDARGRSPARVLASRHRPRAGSRAAQPPRGARAPLTPPQAGGSSPSASGWRAPRDIVPRDGSPKKQGSCHTPSLAARWTIPRERRRVISGKRRSDEILATDWPSASDLACLPCIWGGAPGQQRGPLDRRHCRATSPEHHRTKVSEVRRPGGPGASAFPWTPAAGKQLSPSDSPRQGDIISTRTYPPGRISPFKGDRNKFLVTRDAVVAAHCGRIAQLEAGRVVSGAPVAAPRDAAAALRALARDIAAQPARPVPL
jgi:hypothetical protein